MEFTVTEEVRSALPAGGSPQDDRDYLAWRRAFEDEQNTRWLDRHTRFGDDLPGREPLTPGRIDEWLFLKTGGTRMFEGYNDSHRLRHLAIAFKAHRRQMVKLAHQYAARRLHLCEVA